MKQLMFFFILLSSLSSLACNWSPTRKANTDTWGYFYGTKLTDKPFGQAGSLSLCETNLGFMNDDELVQFAKKLHHAFTNYGNQGSEEKTISAVQDLMSKESSMCELADILSRIYTFLGQRDVK